MTVACCQTVQMLAKTPRETQQREQQMSEATSDSCGWRPATRYPDPAIHAIDPRFEKYWLKLSAVARLTAGFWLGAGAGGVWGRRVLFWSGHSQQRPPP